MLIASFPAGPWQTNCYVVAAAPGQECVVIDPGMDSAGGVAELVAEHRLKPVAAVLTHGHLDHMYAVTPLCASYSATCWVHPADRGLLADPLRGMDTATAALLDRLTGGRPAFREPDEVRELGDGTALELAGLTFTTVHAPGHTPGSTMFTAPHDGGDAVSSVVFSGDVLFAGSIGRTDLPGGSDEDMRETLRHRVLTLPDLTAVLPGHGPRTTIAAERADNPYLSAAHLGASPSGSSSDRSNR